MNNAFEDSLKSLILSDGVLRSALLPQTLQLAVGNRAVKGVVKDDKLRDTILLKALDVVEEDVNAIAALCHKLAYSDNASEIDKLRFDLIHMCCNLSALNEILCNYRFRTAVTFESLCVGRETDGFFDEVPWYESMLQELPFWLHEISVQSMELDATLEEDVPNVGKGYVNNFELLGLEYLPDDLDDRDELLKEYLDVGVQPFIMRADDYNEYIKQIFEDRLGEYDPLNSWHTKLRAKLKAKAIGFDAVINGSLEECVIMRGSYGAWLARPYSSLEKRWLIDISRPASRDLNKIVETANERGWLQPQSLIDRSLSS